MSAAELIEQIKALPPAELAIVRSFVLNGASPAHESGPVQYLDREKARVLGDKIMEENANLFRKLAS